MYSQRVPLEEFIAEVQVTSGEGSSAADGEVELDIEVAGSVTPPQLRVEVFSDLTRSEAQPAWCCWYHRKAIDIRAGAVRGWVSRCHP